jgi:branched-chain amino acid transport system permease protein
MAVAKDLLKGFISRLDRKRVLRSTLLLMATALLYFVIQYLSNIGFINAYYMQILNWVGINMIMGVSLNLINGITGQFSLGHAGFMAIGAYVSAYLTKMQGLPFSLALLMGGLMAGFGGLIVGVPTLRLKGDYLAIATLGFGEIIRVVIINLEVVGGPRGIPGIPQYTNFLWVFAMVIHGLLHIQPRQFQARPRPHRNQGGRDGRGYHGN